MERKFRDFVVGQIEELLSRAEWRRAKIARHMNIPSSGVLWVKRALNASAWIYLNIDTKGDRFSVHFAWARDSSIEEFAGHEAVLRCYQEAAQAIPPKDAALKTVMSFDRGWIHHEAMFDSHGFGYSTARPSLHRMGELFEDPRKADQLRELVLEPSNISDWKAAGWQYSWSLLASFDELRQEDVIAAVGETAKRLLEPITGTLLPVAEEYLSATGRSESGPS